MNRGGFALVSGTVFGVDSGAWVSGGMDLPGFADAGPGEPMVPELPDSSAGPTLRCSFTEATPGTFLAISLAFLRSSLLGTEPVSSTRPLCAATRTPVKAE